VIPDLSAAVCFVCQSPGDGLAFTPSGKSPKWLCDSPDCLALASSVYAMPSKESRKVQHEARLSAGAAAGAYLERIGKTDLAELTPDEWQAFLTTYDNARADHMRRLAAEWAPPL
jgi:hypothetical protein